MMIESPPEPALQSWLAANIASFRGPFTLTKFAGGQSNPTYRIDAASGRYVLRRKPMGQLLASAHAVDREFSLMAAIWPLGFPVPQPLALCSDPGVLGSMFYVMELAEGLNHWDGTLPSLTPRARGETYRAMVDTLAALHMIDVAKAGLESYGKPGNYFERQIARWSRQYRQAQTDDIEDMERLIACLPHTVPEHSGTAIVHGDYRIDNVIFTPNNKVRAVIDWELSTLGDPLADFSYFALQWVLPADGRTALGGLDCAALGIPRLEELTVRYCAATGRTVLPDLTWYFAYNLFRLAAIVQGIKKRMLDGTASNSAAAETAARAPMFAEQAWRFASRAQARAG